MAGLIDDQMPAAPAVPGAQVGAPAGQGDAKRSPQAIMGMLHLNPQQKTQLQRIVAAGMKVMFDQQSHQLMLKQMDGPGALPEKIGQGVAGLMGMLMSESKNSIPQELIVPAGLVLLAHAVDFLDQTGVPVSDEDFGQAVDVFVSTVLKAYKIDPDKVAEIAGGAQQQMESGEQAEAPSEPIEPEEGAQ